MKRLLLFIVIISLGACAYVDPSITQQMKIYSDAKLQKSDVVMSAQPRSRQHQPLTALFIPFFIREPVTDHVELGRELGGIFYQTWRDKQMFPIFEYAADRRYMSRERAIRLGRSKGADLVVLGFIPHIYAGSTVDDTDISLQIRIYETRKGMLLFNMAQAGRIEFQEKRDFIAFSLETRLPSSPLHQLIRSMAHDMAVPVQSWLPSPGTPYRFADDRAGIVSAMTAPPAPSESMPQKDAMKDVNSKDSMPETGSSGTMQDAAVMERDISDAPAGGGGVNLDIQFDVDKAAIRSESNQLLDSLGQALLSPELKGKKIIIAGHTDSDADDLYNLNLSKQRAEAVKRYLVNKFQIAPDLLTTVGYGESRPLAPNDNAANKQKNRRVEVRLDQ